MANDENALAKSRRTLPKKAGASTGHRDLRPVGEARAAERGRGLAPGGLEPLHGGHEGEHHEGHLEVEVGDDEARARCRAARRCWPR